MVTIEVDRCDGCGACIRVCLQGAVSLVEGVAQIDASRCTECGACAEACPMGAIHVAMPITEREPAEVAPHRETVPSMVERGALATLAGAVLTFVGRYLLPRAAEALFRVLEQSPNQGVGAASSRRTSPSEPDTTSAPGEVGKPSGRRRRYRGGR